MASPVVLAVSLGKRYGRAPGHRALRDLDLRVERGELFGFLGPNGAGKSTTIRLLLGLLRPTEGSATVLGLDAWNYSPAIKRKVGYLPGEVRFRERSTGREILHLFSRLRGCPCHYDALAERFALDLDRSVRAYSKGMKQKLGLIQALMHNPELIILDEPTSGLDPISQRAVNELLRERSNAGATVFFSSHVLPEVEGLCDRVALLRGGLLLRCAALDDFEELKVRRFEIAFDTPSSALRALDSLGDVTDDVAVTGRSVHGRTSYVAKLLQCFGATQEDSPMAGADLNTLKIEQLRLEELFYQLYGDESDGGRSTGPEKVHAAVEEVVS